MTILLYVMAWLLSLVLGVLLVVSSWLHLLLSVVGREVWAPWDWWLVPGLMALGFGSLWLFVRLHEEGP